MVIDPKAKSVRISHGERSPFKEWRIRTEEDIFGETIDESKKAQKQLKQIEKRLKSLASEVTRIKTGYIEALALFVALFTFVSIQFQALINADKAVIVTIAVTSLAGLLAFTSLTILVTAVHDVKKMIISGLIFTFSLFLTMQLMEIHTSYLSSRDKCDMLYEQLSLNESEVMRESSVKNFTEICLR